MPLDFPNSPNIGDTWTGGNGVEYVWDGTKWVANGFPGGTGAYATKPYVDARIVSVLDHGARGDGTSDDTDAIQTTINTYAGKAAVFIPVTGSSYIVGPLFLPSHTDLIIDGTLLLKAGSATTIIAVNNQSNVTIRGSGVVDGNAANVAAGAAGINIANSNTVTVTGITIQNPKLWCLAASGSGCYNVYFDKCSMIGGGSANGFAAGAHNCWMTNCFINGPANDEGFAFYGGVYNCGAIGNTITGAYDAGFSVLNDSGQPTPCRDIIISNNVIHGCGYTGIGVGQGVGGTGAHWAITIANNRLYNNNLDNAPRWCPHIAVDHTGVVVISDNIISDDDTNTLPMTYPCTHGIYLDSNVTDATITGNSIFNVGNSAVPGIGIGINSANVVQVNGNTFCDFRSPPYMSGIGGTAGVANSYTSNVFANLTGTTISNGPGPINVRDFGARGDGTTDDTVAVQRAFNAASAGGEIWFPPGNYVLASTITQSFTASVSVRGAGQGVSILSCASNGLALSQASNMRVTVEGLSIVTTASGVANTGLAISGADKSTTITLRNLMVRGTVSRTTSWQTGISLVTCAPIVLDTITVLMPDGTGVPGPTGVLWTGLNASQYGNNLVLSNSFMQGGQYGLRMGNYIEGVFVIGSILIGMDYSVYWYGPASDSHANMLEISNSHLNPTTAGVYANGVNFVSVLGSFFLRGGAGLPTWAGIDLETCGYVTVSANNMLGGGINTESGVVVNGSSNAAVSITGNTFVTLNSQAILLSGNTSAATITGNSASSMPTGAVFVNDTTGTVTNQTVGNSFNGSPGIKSGPNGVTYSGLPGGNNNAIGFLWTGTGVQTYVDGSPQGVRGPLYFNPLPVNAANDAAAASDGVPVGGVYRNGSVMMVRMA